MKDSNPTLYERITTFKSLRTCYIRKKEKGISSIIKITFKLQVKNPQIGIFPIYSLKIELKHTISCFYPIQQYFTSNLDFSTRTNRWMISNSASVRLSSFLLSCIPTVLIFISMQIFNVLGLPQGCWVVHTSRKLIQSRARIVHAICSKKTCVSQITCLKDSLVYCATYEFLKQGQN